MFLQTRFSMEMFHDPQIDVSLIKVVAMTLVIGCG